MHIPAVLERHWIKVEGLRRRLDMSLDVWHRRATGQTPWGEDDISDTLAFLHEIGRSLTRLRRRDLVDPHTPLRKAGQQRIRRR